MSHSQQILRGARLVLAFAVLSTGLVAGAEDFTIVDVRPRTGDAVTTVAQLDLGALEKAIRGEGPKALRDLSPGTFPSEVKWVNFKFTNLTLNVTSVRFRKLESAHELGLTISSNIRADRAKRRNNFYGPFEAHGHKDIAALELHGRLQVTTKDGKLVVKALLDSASLEILLNPVDGLTLHQQFGGKSFHVKDVTVPGNLQLTDFRFVEVQSSSAVVELDVP